MKRIIHIDAVKVIASFMIVVYHFTEYGFIDFGFTVGKDYIPGLGKCLLGLCSAGVPLFFLVSGIITGEKCYGIRKLIKRILNIFKVYFFWGIIIFILISPEEISLQLIMMAIVNNLWYFWFFKTLALLYVINFFINMTQIKMQLVNFMTSLLLVFPFTTNLFFVVISCLYPDFAIPSYGISGAWTLYSLVYFYLYITYPSQKKHCLINIGLILCGLILNFCELYIYTNKFDYLFDNVNSLFPTWSALFITCGIYHLIKFVDFSSLSNRIKGLITLIGQNAISIYIFHIPYIVLLRHYYSGYCNVFLGGLFCILIFVFAFLTGLLIKKTKVGNFLLKL